MHNKIWIGKKDFDMSEKQIKALFAITTELQKKVEDLKIENEELKKRLDQLENIGANQAAAGEQPSFNPFSKPPTQKLFG